LQASQKPIEDSAQPTNKLFQHLMAALSRGRRLFELIDQSLTKAKEVDHPVEQGLLGKRQRTE